MQIRWSASIALWTILGGPVLNDWNVNSSAFRDPMPKKSSVKQRQLTLAQQIKESIRGLNVLKY